MGKFVGGLLNTLYGPVTGLIFNGKAGLMQGLSNSAAALAGPVAFGVYALSSAFAAANAPKADTAVSSIKTSRPPRVGAYGEMRLYGAYILYETGSNGAAIDGYVVHDGPMTAPVAFYIGDDKVTHKSGVSYPGGLINGLADGRYGDDTTRFYWTDGRVPGTTIPVIYNDLPGVWGTNHRGDNSCLIYTRFASVKSKNFLKRFPNGAAPASIAAQWQKCPDPWAADPCDHSAWTWTENPIRQLLHYILYREAPKPAIPATDPSYASELMALRVAYYNRKIAPAIETWQAASDVCDEAVALKAGGTEARYRSCLSHLLTAKHGEVKTALLALCDGWMAPRSDGSLAVYAGKYYTPTVSIGPEHIIAHEWDGVGVDDDQAVNEIVCSYISKAHDYNSVETTAWRDEDDIAERRSQLSASMDMQTPSWGQVRRLAKRNMARNNALYRGTVTTNIAGRIARGQRYIHLLIREGGATFFDGVAEITAVSRNSANGGITFSWVAADPNIDAWNAATEEGDPAAVGDRVALAPLDTPTITDADPEFSGDGSAAQIVVDVDAPDREDLTWYARWKLASSSVWNEQTYSDIDGSASVTLVVGLVPLNSSIDVAVAYQVGDGRVSDWSATETVDTSTAGLAPGQVTEVAISSPATGQATIAWREPTTTNYYATKLFRNTSNSFGTATQVGADMLGSLGESQVYDDTGLSAGTYYYWLQTVSVSAVEGSPVATGAVTVA